MKKTISISGTSIDKEQVTEFLNAIDDAPSDTEINVKCHPGDRPWESTHYTLSATYERKTS